MTKRYQFQMTINPLQFDTMMTEDRVKDYFKERLAFDLAKKLIESNRTTFTYNKDSMNDSIILKASIDL